ncbi:uncharacterized protein LOC119795164 [Cyprinodon tularosa]|uniref:uncharacterized protein LOC119795164 n=1 Tax=Cyprinodon tularosa TaxID=77115 RepID=UPI0018E1DB5E|nr:uncharacterized protein LOC119795164 [Cyprinodon tularosa]
MAKLRAKHGRCSVTGCINEHKSLFLLPSSEPLKTQWMDFIFGGNLSAKPPKELHVCARHFEEECFHNMGAYKAGFATHLKLKSGSIPTLRYKAIQASQSSPSTQLPAYQTNPLGMPTVKTQQSFLTPQPSFRSVGVQTTASFGDFSVGTTTAEPLYSFSSSVRRPSKRRRLGQGGELDQEDESLDGSSSNGLDSTYDPADPATVLTETTSLSEDPSTPVHNLKKYIVYESCIMELFVVCPACMRLCDVRTHRRGTFLSVEQRCPHCEFYRQWNSQPLLGSTPAGDLQLSAAVYLSGASFWKIARVFDAMQLQTFQYDTFRRHARAFIEPAVVHQWKTSQEATLQRLSQQGKVILGGNMRADSPGNSAKIGSYTIMDLSRGTVLDIQLLQSIEVGGIYQMEKEGLRRSLELLESRGVTPDCLVTDRHPQVQKFLTDKNITHYYDVWHMEKGISKKLEKISKKKGFEKLQKWTRSIKNHIYWTAATSRTGPERVAKWTSFLNHMRDVHAHDDPLYPKCLHDIRRTRDKRKWLRAETPAFHMLERVLTNRRTLKDVAKLSPHHQTSSLEAFHSVILHFTPKNVIFPFIGKLCRLYLAAMHYNENANRPQAKTREGVPLFKVHFPKAMKGECSMKPHRTKPTFSYVADLMGLIFDKVFVDPTPYTSALLAIPVPEDFIEQYERPEKEEVIASYVSRLNRGSV